MTRRQFLADFSRKTFTAAATAEIVSHPWMALAQSTAPQIEPLRAKTWLMRWEKSILNEARSRYCDKEMGEEIGWLISPLLNGFYYGYMATHDTKWVDLLVDWTDSWVRRSVTEPDGFLGWPKTGAAGTDVDNLNSYYADSLLGEVMALLPIVLMAREIRQNPVLKSKYQAKAESYLNLSSKIFEKWDQRGAWRETANSGGISVVQPFGVDQATGKWSPGYDTRKDPRSAFSHPCNKANHTARWLLAMHDATGEPSYKPRAEKWFRLMKSRLKTRDDGKYFVWNYWEPAGPWDYKPDGSTKHWVGVHPNGGYYQIDAQGIIAAYEHGLVFTKEDIDRLIATNRDFMWNKKMEGAAFQRLDGGQPEAQWKNTPGVLWESLTPYDETLRDIFIANHDPASWGGLAVTPWFLSLAKS
jgi:hypothetical protein